MAASVPRGEPVGLHGSAEPRIDVPHAEPGAESRAEARAPSRQPQEVLRVIPEATVARLATYLQALSRRELPLGASGAAADATISSDELAVLAGVNPAKLRKDLSHLGSHGTRGVGYDVTTLSDALGRALGTHRVYPVAIVGVGHLGSALAGYRGFSGRGFPIRVLLDSDPATIGSVVADIEVSDIRDAVAVCRAADVMIGAIATPASQAQQVADVLITAGVHSILNFSPSALDVPDEVDVRRVDLALELQLLAFHAIHRGAVPASREAAQ